MSLICEESHLCFGEEGETKHQTSHLCFGKRHYPQLDELEARAVALVVETAVDQLIILRKTIPETVESYHDTVRDLDARFKETPPLPKIYPEMAGRWPPQTEALLKIQQDSHFSAAILEDVLAELRNTYSFVSLKTALDCHSAMIADESKLLEQHKDEIEKRQELLKQLANDRKSMLDQRKFWEDKTELLTSNLHDTYLLGGLSISYANAWEHNRREQQGLVLGHKEDTLHDTIEKLQDSDGPNEERIHTEIMRFLGKDTEILRKNLDHWTDLYDAEMMQRETENMQLRSKLEQKKEEQRVLVEEDAHRTKIISEAANLRAKYEEHKTVMKSIIAIQAWWRGVSFRAGIRTTKPKKDKKKKKKRKRGRKVSKKKGKTAK
ncbi:Dynein regulatory complex protein 9 [Frankliniella fusca]|uniref:Dynein regulatory complex protein 9 n=1 Tax=Frankliniella fusca TaxID=407009 RepID=A0AAE1I5K6_9NEOP|nr:Dynein regulatory complex protein 9 [Frankliniella fusca]